MDYVKNSDKEKGTSDDATKNPADPSSITIPAIEEHLKIEKEIVETGKVRLIKKVTEDEVNIDTPLLHDIVEVERTAVNQFVDTAPEVHYEGETMVIPVVKEVLVKRLMVVEEIRVSKKQIETHNQQSITVRRETVVVERDNKGMQPEKGTISKGK